MKHTVTVIKPKNKRAEGVPSKSIGMAKRESLEMLDFDPSHPMTSLEKEALRIALGVLRSETDYADFLNSWLQDYGRQILSPNSPPPLLPAWSVEETLALTEEDAPAYIN